MSACTLVKCGLADLHILVRSFRPILGESSLRFCVLCGLSDLALLQGGLSDLIVGVSCEAYSQWALFDSERQIRVYFVFTFNVDCISSCKYSQLLFIVLLYNKVF